MVNPVSLKRFVDRGTQSANFAKMLDGTTHRRIMTITAPTGMGKSWLLRAFVHEVQRRRLPYSLIDFADRQGYNTLGLIRRFRNDIGEQYFEQLTVAIQDVTTPRIQVADPLQSSKAPIIDFASGQFGDITIQDVAGQNIIKNSLLYVQADNEVARQAAEDRICSAFFACLHTLSDSQQVILLFDTYERLSTSNTTWEPTPADYWIREKLLFKILNSELTNVIVVIAGRHLPAFDSHWDTSIGAVSISALGLADVEEYLRDRLYLQDVTPEEVKRLYQAVDGHPQLLGMIGDNLVRNLRLSLPDELW